MLAGSWVTIRTLAAQVGEAATAPTSSAFVDLGQVGPRLEVAFDGGSTPSAPTSVTFTAWRLVDGVVHKVGAFTVAVADIALVTPQLFEFNASRAYVTVSFTGGSTPTATGTVRARVVFGA